MTKALLPVGNSSSGYKRGVYSDWHYTICTDKGLVKQANEDRVGFIVKNNLARFVVADGHWGSRAAQMVAEYWLSLKRAPDSITGSILENRKLESSLYKEWGVKLMDEDSDLTPEAGFVCLELLDNGRVRIISYGDCRAIVIRDGRIIFELEQSDSWLGAFSSLGLRARLSVDEATKFSEIKLSTGDTVILFSDGIDECVYGRPTIPLDKFAKYSKDSRSADELSRRLIDEVIKKGAEDNYSMAVLRYTPNDD